MTSSATGSCAPRTFVPGSDPRERPLRRHELAADPLEQFNDWFEDARSLVRAPEATALATTTADGRPSVRMVLLKRADEDGLVFFSHYRSRKGRELAETGRAALLFYWDPLGRQVRVEGPVDRVAAAESDAYYATRPIGARRAAVVSRQSDVVESRDALERAIAALGESEPPRPDWWGGFLLVPETWEFWQHRADRLHDRFRYRRDGDAWIIERLAP
jgi:pyridoxamine 5'-phosphate oxidase